MKKKMFEELLGSVREAGAILRGEKKPSRRMVIGSSAVRKIPETTTPQDGRGLLQKAGYDNSLKK